MYSVEAGVGASMEELSVPGRSRSPWKVHAPLRRPVLEADNQKRVDWAFCCQILPLRKIRGADPTRVGPLVSIAVVIFADGLLLSILSDPLSVIVPKRVNQGSSLAFMQCDISPPWSALTLDVELCTVLPSPTLLFLGCPHLLRKWL